MPSKRIEIPKPKKLIAYLDHPIGEKDGHKRMDARLDNLENAGRWLRWLIERTDLVVLAPWWTFIAVIDDELWRPRLMIDQIWIMTKASNLLVQCGGYVSPHMKMNREKADKAKLPVADLTGFGIWPPVSGPFLTNAMAELNRAIQLCA